MRCLALALILLALRPALAQTPPEPVWQYRMLFPIRVISVGEEGVALVGSDFGNTIHALDAAAGRLLWKRDLGGTLWSPPTQDQGIAYISPNAQSLISLKLQTGESPWWLGPRFPGGVAGPPWQTRAPPVIGDGYLLSLSLNGTLSRVGLDGKLLAQAMLQAPDQRDQFWARPVVVGSDVYVGSVRGTLHRLSAERLNRLSRTSLGSEIRGELATREGVLYVPTVDGTLRAYRSGPDGLTPLWALQLERTYQVTSLGRVPLVPVLATEGPRLFTAVRGAIMCLDEAGRTVWGRSLPRPAAGPVAVYKDRVLMATDGGTLLAFSAADGKLAGRWQLRATPLAGPVVWGDMVLLGYPDGVVEGFIF